MAYRIRNSFAAMLVAITASQAVGCKAPEAPVDEPPPSISKAGGIAVAVTVSGTDGSPTFKASVDDGAGTDVKGNATTVIGTAFSAGAHVVRLLNVTPYCYVAGDRSALANVKTPGSAQDPAVVSFTVLCNSTRPAETSGVILGSVADSATGGRLVNEAVAAITLSHLKYGDSVTIHSNGAFGYRGLEPGQWRLNISAAHFAAGVWPDLKLYRDTSVLIDVKAGDTTVIPAITLKPQPPILLIGVHSCGGLPDPPTMNDWNSVECEGGFWGGVKVVVDVDGVQGTATAGQHFHGTIGDPSDPPNAQTRWSALFNISVAGDYDVAVVSVAPIYSSQASVVWRLVPWENSVTRVSVTNVIGYTGLDFWYH